MTPIAVQRARILNGHAPLPFNAAELAGLLTGAGPRDVVRLYVRLKAAYPSDLFVLWDEVCGLVDPATTPPPARPDPAGYAPPAEGSAAYHVRYGWPVGPDTAPPDAVAYAEDSRERLWTGKGPGLWRCLTDLTHATTPGPWPRVWSEHGPMVPMVPGGEGAAYAVAGVLSRYLARNRLPRRAPFPVDAGALQWARDALLAAAESQASP